jgi:NADPH2:quinone reductase
MLVLFGQSSGKVPPFDPGVLAQKGSLYLTRPSLSHYVATREELEESANALFEVVKRKQVRVEINQRYPLREADSAHADLEARRTTGSSVLTV